MQRFIYFAAPENLEGKERPLSDSEKLGKLSGDMASGLFVDTVGDKEKGVDDKKEKPAETVRGMITKFYFICSTMDNIPGDKIDEGRKVELLVLADKIVDSLMKSLNASDKDNPSDQDLLTKAEVFKIRDALGSLVFDMKNEKSKKNFIGKAEEFFSAAADIMKGSGIN